MFKICNKCKKEKDLENFHKSKNNKLGRNNTCSECRSKRSAKRYASNKFKSVLITKKSFCKNHNILFDLDEEYLKGLWTGVCPVFGVKLHRKKKRDDNQASLDRIDPNKGYIKGNVMYISSRANRIKYDATVEELERIVKYMKENS